MLSVISWNMLANAYVRPAYFPHTPASILDPEARVEALLHRLVQHATQGAADVLCLQEVEPELFEAATLRLSEFNGQFVQKRGKPDGCAIFVRRTLGVTAFRELTFADGSGHVAVAAIVSGVAVTSTHLKWQAADVPLDERLGCAELRELLETLDTWMTVEGPRIVCGDLNAEAGSPVLDLAFARGLRDAYASLPHAFTANANGRRKRIDFILHTADFVAVPTALPTITDTTPLPSGSEPSDHLAIRAKLDRRSR